MKKILGLSLATLLVMQSSFAADVKVEWKNPDKYRDIVNGNTQGKSQFRSSLFSELEKTFADEAAAINNKYHLKIIMIDVDLAGQVQLGKAIEVRTVNDFDFPRLKFYLYLYDDNNNIVLQGVQNLKEKKDKHNSFRMKGSQSSFYLEKDLIKKWYKQALIPAINKL
jgi:hypothetical protein